MRVTGPGVYRDIGATALGSVRTEKEGVSLRTIDPYRFLSIPINPSEETEQETAPIRRPDDTKQSPIAVMVSEVIIF